MRMGFDLDGVVVDSFSEMIREGQRIGCIPNDVVISEISGRLEHLFGISDDDMRRILSVEVYRRSRPVDEVISDIIGWMGDGHQIHFVTARSDECTQNVRSVTAEWLSDHGLYDGCSGVHHVRSTMKWMFARDSGISVFVDDMPHVIGSMIGVVPHPFLLAIDQNESVDGRMRRWSWGEIRHEIDRLSVGWTSRPSNGRTSAERVVQSYVDVGKPVPGRSDGSDRTS